MNEHAFRLLIIQAWQITALATVVAVVVKVAAKNRPHLAHALWVLVLIKCVTPPLWGHSLGVFSQLQARLVPDESASLPDVSDPPARGPVAIAETLMSAPEIDVADSEHGQLETYEPDDLFPMADTESPLDASFVWDGGTDIERSESQSLSIEGDASGLPPEEFEANIANAGPALPIERVESDASWLRPGWLLPSGLVAGAIVTLFIMVFRCLRCLRLIHRHRTTEFDDQLRARIQHLSGQLRIRRIPQIIVSDVLFGPAVLGLLRHTIVLPRCLFTSMKAESGERKADARGNEQHATTTCSLPLSAFGFPLSFLDPILAHELLHIRRGDLRTGTLQAIVQSLWWFHPAVWLSNRWLSREAERCCDEQVIAELGCSPAQYARSLLSVIECKHQLQPIPVFPGMKPVEITTQRMERIMSLRNGLKKRTPLWCWLTVVALAIVVLPGAVAKPSPDESSASARQASSLPITPPAASVSKQQDIDTTDNRISTPAGRTELTADERIQPTEMARPVPEFVLNSSDPLVRLVWDAREASRRRLLMTDQRTPWQLMNGLMALRRDFVLRDGDEVVNGLEWVQSGPKIPGSPWFQKTEHGGQPDPDPAPIWFDDHAQAFLAALAMSEVPIDAKFATPDGPITMGDMIKHLQMTVSEMNLSPWTLCALSKYLSPDAEWVNANGEDWSIEKLVKIEIEKPVVTIHPISLIAVTYARDRYLRTKQPLLGVWLEAQDKIQEVIQNGPSRATPEGGFRPKYFHPTRLPHVKSESARTLQNPFPSSRLGVSDVGYPYSSDNWQRIHQTAMPRRTTDGRDLLLFFVTALSDDELHEDWVRNAFEVAANEMLADWANAEIRSPFYETTQALSIYLERIAMAGATTPVDQTEPFTVQVKGLVRCPGIWQAPINKNLRLTDAIQLSGGATDDAAKTVYVIRNRRKSPEPMILQIGYNGSERGAEPNIFLAPGDEVLLQSPEIVKTPIANSIRLDDSFVLSPEMPITGSSVIVYVNDRQITVERFIGSLWNRLEETPEITETLKRRVALEAIASGLPEFVFQQLIEDYFHVHAADSIENESMPLREVTDQQFTEAIEKASKFDADPRMRARTLLALLARGSSPEVLFGRQQRVARYVRGMRSDSVGNKKSAVIKHVQELLTTARLRNVVSLDFTNVSLSDVVQTLEKDQNIEVEMNSLHAQIGSRIFDKPATVEFHCKNTLLGDAIKGIVEPFGMTTHLRGDSVLLQFADSQEAMAKFRSLPGPPSFGVFGIVKNTGWQVLDKEIRLLDALAIAGGVANPEGVSIEITNPDIIVGKAIPVSMSLRILQNDASGKLNRIVKDGDIISVMRNGSADALPAKESGAGVMNGKGVNGDAGLVGTVRFDQPSNVADDENSAAASEVEGNSAGRRYDGPPTPEVFRESRLESPGKLLVPERPMPPEIQQSSDPLLKLVWEARESSRRRLLTTDQHTPWQLMQGLLGLRQDFLVKHDGKIINGLEWIQSGPTFKDEPPFQENQPWFQKTKHGGRAHPYLRPYLFEGHINQFAAILASCRLPLSARFETPDGPITMQDLITNAQMTANQNEEVSWTLSLLSRYLPPDAKWMNAKGEEWSIERLVKVEVGKDLPGAPCGGTCGLLALAVARHEYLRSGKPLEGVWLEAENKVRRYILTARMQQNPNGTLSSNCFRGREYKQDFDKRLASSGAVLQFLMMAASDEQLKEDWLRRAVEATANDLMTNRKAFVGCSPLFETTNAFSIYLDRVLLSRQTAALPSPVVNNVAAASTQTEVEKPAASVRMVLATYAVADLIVPLRNDAAKVAGPVDTSRTADSATASSPSPDNDRASNDPLPALGGSEKSLNMKAEFAPLTELIKASMEPDSWQGRGTIAVDETTLSLVIRQSQVAHEEIAELLTQLRDAQDQSVRIPCLVVRLTKEAQTKWLEEQCSLHSLEHGSRWALLPQQRGESFTQALLEQKPEVFSRPVLRATSGQTTMIAVGQLAAFGTAKVGIRLEVTPHVLPYSNVIRLQHSFAIGEFTDPMPEPGESLVGSGQTLLLVIDDPEEKEKPDEARPEYLYIMTPAHIAEIEAVKTLETP